MAQKIHEEMLLMTGISGVITLKVPSNMINELLFVTVVNPSDNSVCFYPGSVTEPTPGLCRFRVPPYTTITLPIWNDFQHSNFNILWSNDFGTNPSSTKNARIIFSNNNLMLNLNFSSGIDRVIAQVVDEADDFLFTPINPAVVTVAGSTFVEHLTQVNAQDGKLTFSAPIKAVEIHNLGENPGTFRVNGTNILVQPGEKFRALVKGIPRDYVTVFGTDLYVVSRYE